MTEFQRKIRGILDGSYTISKEERKEIIKLQVEPLFEQPEPTLFIFGKLDSLVRSI